MGIENRLAEQGMWEEELGEMFGFLNTKLEYWTLMGSGDPLKNETILLVAVRNRSHKVEDTGFAEMGFGFFA